MSHIRGEIVIARAVEAVFDFVADGRLEWMDVDGALTFEPDPEGTRMRWSSQTRQRGLLRLMGPVVTQIGRCQERRIWPT